MEDKYKKRKINDVVYQGVNKEVECHVIKSLHNHWLLKELVSNYFN